MSNNHLLLSSTFKDDEPEQLDSTECEYTEGEHPLTNG
jgi:hypothetical protein